MQRLKSLSLSMDQILWRWVVFFWCDIYNGGIPSPIIYNKGREGWEEKLINTDRDAFPLINTDRE